VLGPSSGFGVSRSIWFTLQADLGTYVISTCAGTDEDTVLWVYTSFTNDCSGSAWTLVACNDGSCNYDFQSQVTLTVTSPQLYYIICTQFGTGLSPFNKVTLTSLGPSVTTTTTTVTTTSTTAAPTTTPAPTPGEACVNACGKVSTLVALSGFTCPCACATPYDLGLPCNRNSCGGTGTITNVCTGTCSASAPKLPTCSAGTSMHYCYSNS
jgi:hypothetical protein